MNEGDLFEKGDILISQITIHPIVFLKKKDEYYFHGCMITHSNTGNYKNNIALLPQHFEPQDTSNNKYSVLYDDSYFVNLTLIKKNEWRPFKKVGKLSKDGIIFLEGHLSNSDPIEWKKYINKK